MILRSAPELKKIERSFSSPILSKTGRHGEGKGSNINLVIIFQDVQLVDNI